MFCRHRKKIHQSATCPTALNDEVVTATQRFLNDSFFNQRELIVVHGRHPPLHRIYGGLGSWVPEMMIIFNPERSAPGRALRSGPGGNTAITVR
jgi:hypothetical protein